MNRPSRARPTCSSCAGRSEHINQHQQDGPSLAVEVQRSTEQATVVRLSVARADTAQLEVVAQELYRQREQLRAEPERQQESFLRVDYPLAKDFNQELAYTLQGLSAEQIRDIARREESQRESERQQRLAQAQRLAQEQRALERQAQRERENSPEAQQQQQRDDRRFNQAGLGARNGGGRAAHPLLPQRAGSGRAHRPVRARPRCRAGAAQGLHPRQPPTRRPQSR